MKKLSLLLFLALFASISVFSQILQPVKWSFSSKIINDKEAELYFTAKIDDKWHLYSQYIPEGGPVSTSFNFDKSNDFKIKGKIIEPKAEELFDANFDMKLKFFSHKVVFIQKIERLSNKPFVIKGNVSFMCCDDKQCLPPDEIEFSIKMEGATITSTTETKLDTAKFITNNDTTPVNKDTIKTTITQTSETKEGNKESKSLWYIFWAGFLGGLIALLTPCVFPMIPMTVSFFIKKTKSRAKSIKDALIYGLSIIVIYVGLGLGVTLIFGADALNELSTNPWFNVAFFAILVLFAFAFFGAFELQLPSSWVNKMDSKADKSSGLLGIFFMAFTLVLVSFSCTGPIIGTLLVEAVSTGATSALIGMTGFAIALSIPFTLFAIFPSWLKSLPKSGGWLNSVKVVLGFLELALALKFLSTADLVSHWGILSRETFLVLWIVIFTMLGFYLLGKMKFAHDSDLPYISVPRLMMAIISLGFALYMVPGLWGAPLKAISAFAPPMATQDFNLAENKVILTTNENQSHNNTNKKNADLFHCPHGLNCYFDYEEGLAEAKRTGKPLFIDFTGHGCVNCRNMEASVWADKEVLKRLNNDYIMVSLYVDDKTELPENEKYVSKIGDREKKIKTIGNKWSDLQAKKFGTNSQPYYVLLDHKEDMLIKPHAFDLDVQKYVEFLENGIKEFKKRNKK